MSLSRLFSQKNSSPDHVDVFDGCRMLFILLVGWYHIWQQSWLTPRVVLFGEVFSMDPILRSGYIWVDAMLLLSAMVLYLPYALHPEKRPENAGRFYFRRFRRIWPSYCLVVLVCLVFRYGEYRGDTAYMAGDVAAHLTMTHTFFYKTYYGSPLNGALWTVGVEWWFYMLFPLLLRFYQKNRLVTAIGMIAVGLVWRWYVGTLLDMNMKNKLFNQMPAFLDVFAFGFIGADAFAALKRKKAGETAADQTFFSVICVIALVLLYNIICKQASSNGVDAIRQGQMDIRFMFCLTVMCFMVGAAFSVKGIRKLLGNKLTVFLASITYWFYMIHQPLAVAMKDMRIVPSVSSTPNQAGEFAWQLPYTLLCFFVPLALSILMTYLFEKPVYKALGKIKIH